MSMELNRYFYKGEKPFRLIKWKVKAGSHIFPSTVILTYICQDGTDELKLKSAVDGMVQTLLMQEGQLVQPGDALLQLKSCTHEIIMKELCAECGADLRQLSRQNLQEVVAARSFSMVHIVPELKCSLEQAKQLDEADEMRLLKARKLILLVDLDQTLIHTTNEDIPINLKDVHHFQLYGSSSPWYHTRLRPQTLWFLERISHYYELHIFTFGARMYAHKIASILDPDGKLFSHRILSRDECFDGTSKTGNLKSLFPRGDSMVCIIDDREDVWNFAPNVVHVKPYIYFCNTGDINAPSNIRKQSTARDVLSQRKEDVGCKPATIITGEKDSQVAREDDILYEKTHNNEVVEICSSTSTMCQSAKLFVQTSFDSKQSLCKSESETQNIQPGDVGHDEVTASDLMCKTNVVHFQKRSGDDDDDDDDDDYLLYLEEILISIHRAYFDIYDEMSSQNANAIPDLKNVIPYVRRKVLQGVNIVFSGVIPTNMDPEKSSLWALAKSFGANVTKDLILNDGKNNTTHIIASKMGTAKLNKARKLEDVHIVSPSWLICCATRWERADERLFPLKKCSIFSTGLTKKYKKHMKPKEITHKTDNFLNSVNGSEKAKPSMELDNSNPHCATVLDFSVEELEMMGKEVHDACEESGGSSDSSLSHHVSHKRKKLNKQQHGKVKLKASKISADHFIEPSSSSDNSCEQFTISTDSSSNESNVNSEDGELAAEVEQKLLNSIPSSPI